MIKKLLRAIVGLFQRKKAVPRAGGKRAAGGLGEERAKNFLRRKGYKILETNFSVPFGEIDIIAKDRDCLVFVEVRSSGYREELNLLERISTRKKKHISAAASAYMKRGQVDFHAVRFDVVAILGEIKPDIIHIKDAFQLDHWR